MSALAIAAASGCGTRVPYDELLAAAQGGARGTGPTGVASAPGGNATQSVGTVATGAGPIAGGTTGAGALTGGSETPLSGPDASGTGGGGSAATTCTGDEAPLILGMVGQPSGLLGFITSAPPKAMQAWVAMINARGGLDCHQVKYIVADDGGDPARNQALVRQLVEQNGVVAFVNNMAPFSSSGSERYLNEHRIPVIGGAGIEEQFLTSPYYFPQQSYGPAIFEAGLAGTAQEALARGLRRLGVIVCIEVNFCSQARSIAPDVASQYGMQLTYTGSGSLVQPDYSALCQDAQASQAEVLFVILDPNGIHRLAQNCNSVGYHPVFATASIVATNDLPKDPLLDGMIAPVGVAPWMDTSNPGVAEFVQALEQFTPGFEPSAASIFGWASAKMLELAGQHLSNPPTSQDILDGLWSFQGQDFDGLTMPMTFMRDQPARKAVCFWIVTASNGAWTAPKPERTCT